jgi:hypothetical protein
MTSLRHLDRARQRHRVKPGARFVVETPMVLENQLQPRPWWKVGEMYRFVSRR